MNVSAQHTGFFLCSGCDIGNCLDPTGLTAAAREIIPDVEVYEHPALCSENGIHQIQSRIQDHPLGSIAIAACSSRNKSERFNFGPETLTVRINLREQVCRVMEPGNEDTQMCAEDYVRMGLTELKEMRSPVPYIPENPSDEILVLGAGITGLSAALNGARAGFSVHLVEKSGLLGGYAGRVYKQNKDFAYLSSWEDFAAKAKKKTKRKAVNTSGFFEERFSSLLSDPEVNQMIERVQEHPLIKLYTHTSIRSVTGEPGDFRVSLQNKNENSIRVGSIVLATGWKSYDAHKLDHLGYGLHPGVLTNVEFEEFIRENPVPERVVFMMCAGSRDPEHLKYCSTYCCDATLKQVLYARKINPQAELYLIYKDMRSMGFQEYFYKAVQQDNRVFMTRGSVNRVVPAGEQIRVEIRDTLLLEDLSVEADILVLATGMVPSDSAELNLQYRQGKGLPELQYHFPDSHFICFPYETRRTGIYAAGAVRAPMDIAGSEVDGAGAMMKAIQCVENVKNGTAVHPRAGDQTWPEMYMERCTDCKRCTEECPFGTYDENEHGTPLSNPARCRRCGICIGSCPERVIGFSDYSINLVSSVIKSIYVPDEFEEKPRILVLACENDAYPALDQAGFHRLTLSPFVRIFPVRCLGSVNKVWISDALSKGYDGILQIGCKPGDNYQCHFIQGSELTQKRGDNFQEALQSMMLEPERIKTEFIEIDDYQKIVDIINDYVEEIELIGPNPFKEM